MHQKGELPVKIAVFRPIELNQTAQVSDAINIDQLKRNRSVTRSQFAPGSKFRVPKAPPLHSLT